MCRLLLSRNVSVTEYFELSFLISKNCLCPDEMNFEILHRVSFPSLRQHQTYLWTRSRSISNYKSSNNKKEIQKLFTYHTFFLFFHFFCSVVYVFALYRNSHRSPHRKHRRHTNDLTSGAKVSSNSSSRHRLVATSSQLSIEVSELHALNGRLEISCLATIPAHVKPGEQYADYKTYSVKSK